MSGASLFPITKSGRELMVDVDFFGEPGRILFDPWAKTFWLTYEQAASVLKVTESYLRFMVTKAKRRGFVKEEWVKRRVALSRDGRRREITYLSREALVGVSLLKTTTRVSAMVSLGGVVTGCLEEHRPIEAYYFLRD